MLEHVLGFPLPMPEHVLELLYCPRMKQRWRLHHDAAPGDAWQLVRRPSRASSLAAAVAKVATGAPLQQRTPNVPKTYL